MQTEQHSQDGFPAHPQGLLGVIDALPTGVLILSAEGVVELANRGAARILGVEREALAGRPLDRVLHAMQPEARDRLARALDRARRGESVRFQARLSSAEGGPGRSAEQVHVECSLEPLRDGEGGITHVIASVVDTSERMRVTAQLREGNARFHALVDLIPQLVWTATPDGYHDFFNRRWYDYTGMPTEGEQGWNWKDYLHPDDYESTLAVWQHSLDTGDPYEVEYRFRRASDGAYRWFIGRAMPLRRRDGTIVRWFGTCTDVHEERMVLDRLRRSEERYRTVTRATNDVVWEWNIATGALWWNENVERVFGLRVEELPTVEDWVDRLHPDDREEVLAGLEGLLAGGEEVWGARYRLRKPDGTFARVVDRGLAIRDEAGRPVSMIGSMQDVTEQSRLEEELRRAQRLEAVGQLAGGVAHDFNNLLTVITTSTQLVVDAVDEGDPNLEDLNEVLRAAQRASALTRQLLAFSRRQVLQPRTLDLNAIVTGSRRMLDRLISERIRVEFQADLDLRPIRADEAQVEQVIINLALNARDAMASGGVLTLGTRNVTVAGEQARRHPDVVSGEYVRLTVSDTGVGMGPETLDRLFEPFFTTKDPDRGTGLGLPTVQGIVAQSGGFIEVESQLGEGSQFHVYFPALPSDPTLEEGERREPPGRVAAPAVILVVEDQEPVRRAVRRVLTRAGHTVMEAPNGRAALEVIRREGEGIDLILSDLVMPGMGGRELAGRARGEGHRVPFVFMSGYAEEEILRGTSGSGPVEILEKPFTPDELADAVAEGLQAKR